MSSINSPNVESISLHKGSNTSKLHRIWSLLALSFIQYSISLLKELHPSPNLFYNPKTCNITVSPTGQYFNSEKLSICVLGVLEFEVPIHIDTSGTMKLLQDVFLAINPRFSSIMVRDKKGVKQWKRVKVNLQEHIRVPNVPEGLSIESYDDIFDKYLTKIAMEQMPQDRPLWELHLTKYPTSKAAGHCIFKLHHALGDGFSLMGALLSCLQRADDPSLPLTFPSLQPSSEPRNIPTTIPGCVPRTLSTIYNTTCDFSWSVLKSSLIADDKTPIRSNCGAVEFQPA